MEYLIHRQLNCTNIERRVGMASQHWVLWPELVVAMRFADGVWVEHQEERTLIIDPTKPFGLGYRTVQIGKTYVIND